MKTLRSFSTLSVLLILFLTTIMLFGCTKDFVSIPDGTFTMGSPPGEPGRDLDEAEHEVTLSRGFEMMTTEVIQGDFEPLMGYDPSHFSQVGSFPNLPVEQVSWFDALAYANRLSASEGYEECYVLSDIECADETPGDTISYCREQGGIFDAEVSLNGVSSVYDCAGFRLPTEAEWEYAVRAGTTTAFYSGPITNTACSPYDPNLYPIAWYCNNSSNLTHAVGGKAPNVWGLHDMIGNVLEWCWDWYESEYPGSVTDPEGPADGHFRVARGGSCRYTGAGRCRSAFRSGHSPGYRSRYLGFRLVRSVLTGHAAKDSIDATPAGREPAGLLERVGRILRRDSVSHGAQAVTSVSVKGGRDYPDSLPFEFTREDVGEPLTPEEVTAFTQKITAFWDEVSYFHWILWHSHGMDESNPYGMPDYKLYWQDTQAIKSGDLVTFEHRGGADNIMIRTPKVINNAISGYLMSGDPTMGRVVEKFAKGMVALFQGMLWDDHDPESFLMARGIFTQDHSYTEDGRDAFVEYDPVKHESYSWNAHTIPNPDNPYWGDIWVRNMRSKDDVPHLFRAVPLLMRVAEEGADEAVREAAARAVEHMQGFARDIVDSGYYIRTKDMYGNAYVPLADTGMVADLASFVTYETIVPDAECTAKVASALIGYGDPMEVDCGDGIGELYELIATLSHYFNYAIIRYFHVSAITNALMVGENDMALALLEGLADRVGSLFDGTSPYIYHCDWESDVASYSLAAATAGLPLTSQEARHIMEQYSLAVDHYETWSNWDLWDPAVPDGEVPYKPSRNGELGTVVRPTELTYLIEYCYSPFRNEAGAQLVDCDIIADPEQWGK